MWPLTTRSVYQQCSTGGQPEELLLKVLRWLIFHLDLPFVFIQLDNPDEQAAQIRRELDGRLQMAEQIAKVKKKSLLLLITSSFRSVQGIWCSPQVLSFCYEFLLTVITS